MSIWPLLRLLLIFSLMLGGRVGLFASAIHLGIWRAQIEHIRSLDGTGNAELVLTALLPGCNLTTCV